MPLRPLVGGSRDGTVLDFERDVPEITLFSMKRDPQVYVYKSVQVGDPPYPLIFYLAAGSGFESSLARLVERMYAMTVIHCEEIHDTIE